MTTASELGSDLHGDLARTMGIEYVETSDVRVVARMPVAGNTMPYGTLHGGASCVLAETVGSLAAGLHAGVERRVAGLEINATHHRPVRAGHVTATATPVHLGRTVASFLIEIADDDGRRVCTARLTCVIRENGRGSDRAQGSC